MSPELTFHRVLVRETRSVDKVVFKVPTKILPMYEHSPDYIGTGLWNDLSKDTQRYESVNVFKN